MIVLDTSILSLAFRRRRKSENAPRPVEILTRLIDDDEPLGVPGIVFQELLSGMRHREQFRRLDELMRGFPLLIADRPHHREAAQIANACRGKGIAATTIDCLIAAQTIGARGSLLTLDRDFDAMAPLVGLRLFAYP